MANIGGRVLYDSARTAISGTGIANVPVVLYNVSAGTGAVALTDGSGNYLFNNVPNGTYHVIESWGAAGAATPINFGTAAAAMTHPAGVEPPLSALTGVTTPALADMLDAVTPNLLNTTMSGTDITNMDFYDGPIGNKPLSLVGVTATGANLITAAGNGSWGSLSAGTAIKTTSPTEPYPGIAPGFAYSNQQGPPDGSYTVINTYDSGSAWWPISDHTSHTEVGRYAIINPNAINAVFFSQTVTVTPNTDYLFSAWLMNLIQLVGDYDDPMVAFRVRATDNTEVASRALAAIVETTLPVWYQQGFVFNSGAHTSLKIELVNMSAADRGNDYAVDDVALYKTTSVNQLGITQRPVTYSVYGGGTAEFVVTVKNNLNVPASNVTVKNLLDPLLTFTPGSVRVNSLATGYEAASPVVGFSIGSLAAGQSVEVKFSAAVAKAHKDVTNTATATYDILTAGNGDNARRTISGMPFILRVMPYDFSQSFSDMAVGMALEKTALAAVINTQADAIAALTAAPGVSIAQIVALQKDIGDTLQSVQCLESILSQRFRNLEY